MEQSMSVLQEALQQAVDRLQDLGGAVIFEDDRGAFDDSGEGDIGGDLVRASEEREISFTVRGLLVERANRLAEAVDRLRAGEYGSCLTCGDPIAPARLRAMPEVTTCVACQEAAEMARVRGRRAMRARASRVGVGLGAVALSLGLLAGCATSPPAVASDRERDVSACVRASVGFNNRGSSHLPFDIDQDAYRRCLEERGYHLPPSGLGAL